MFRVGYQGSSMSLSKLATRVLIKLLNQNYKNNHTHKKVVEKKTK